MGFKAEALARIERYRAEAEPLRARLKQLDEQIIAGLKFVEGLEDEDDTDHGTEVAHHSDADASQEAKRTARATAGRKAKPATRRRSRRSGISAAEAVDRVLGSGATWRYSDIVRQIERVYPGIRVASLQKAVSSALGVGVKNKQYANPERGIYRKVGAQSVLPIPGVGTNEALRGDAARVA